LGQQEISARDYAVLREVSTFSWLGARHHGRESVPRCAPPCCTWPGGHRRRLRLIRDRWQATDRVPVTVTGLDPCLPLFGLPDT